MSADDLAKALEDLKRQLGETKVLVGRERSEIVDAKRKVDAIVGAASGHGSIQLLRVAAIEFGKASDQVDVAYDALKSATNSVQGYLSAHFRRSGGGSSGTPAEWTASSPVGTAHTQVSGRAQRRAEVKNALFVGATGIIAAVGVGAAAGTLAAALVGGAPLMVAVGAAVGVNLVATEVAFAVSSLRHLYELRVLWVRGSVTGDELMEEIKSRVHETTLDLAADKLQLGVVLNIKALFELTSDLRKV